MKLPAEVVSKRHKIRDYQIVKLYAEGEMNQYEIAEKFGLTQGRIQQICFANRHLMTGFHDWEKAKRINWLKGQIKKNGQSKKDPADLMEQLRKEMDGDQSIVNVNQNHIQVYFPSRKKDELNASEVGAQFGAPRELPSTD